MRKMKTTFAAVGGLYAIATVLAQLLTTAAAIVSFAVKSVPIQTLKTLILTNVSGTLQTVVPLILLAVVLLRGKKDMAAGILLFIAAACRLWKVVSGVLAIILYFQVMTLVAFLAALCEAVLLIAAGLDCIRPMNPGLRRGLFLGSGIAAACLELLYIVAYVVSMASHMGYLRWPGLVPLVSMGAGTAFVSVPFALTILFAALAMAQDGGNQAARGAKDYGYLSMGLHVVLLLVVGPLWKMIWIVRVTESLNRIPGEKRNGPVANLLLCVFVPFYMIYWFYHQGQKADVFAEGTGNPTRVATLCLVFGIFIPVVSVILLQNSINRSAQIMEARMAA